MSRFYWLDETIALAVVVLIGVALIGAGIVIGASLARHQLTAEARAVDAAAWREYVEGAPEFTDYAHRISAALDSIARQRVADQLLTREP